MFSIYFLLIMISLPFQPLVLWCCSPTDRLSKIIHAPYVKRLTQIAAYIIFLLSLALSSTSTVCEKYMRREIFEIIFSNQSDESGRQDQFNVVDIYIIFYSIGQLANAATAVTENGTLQDHWKLVCNALELIIASIFLAAFSLKIVSHWNVGHSFTWWNEILCGVGDKTCKQSCHIECLGFNQSCTYCIDAVFRKVENLVQNLAENNDQLDIISKLRPRISGS